MNRRKRRHRAHAIRISCLKPDLIGLGHGRDLRFPFDTDFKDEAHVGRRGRVTKMASPGERVSRTPHRPLPRRA